MATAAELDAQWEAQYLVVKQKNDERVAAMKTLAASPAYQNATEAEREALTANGPANDARLAFNAENQKLTALNKELDVAKESEKQATEAAKNTPPPPANVAEPTKASPTIADSDKLGDKKAAAATPINNTPKTINNAPNSGTTIAGKAGTVEAKSNNIVGLRDYNPLSKFSSYTYNISLYILDPNAYNRYMDGDRTAIKDFKLLVKSGGSNLAEATRAPGFELDMYIDDLIIKSLITIKSAGTPTTSNREYKFKIYEPYGFSFIHKLTNALGESVTDITKIKGVFFLMIKFYGYDASGKIVYGSDIPGVSNNNADPQSIFERGFAIAFKSLTFKLENKLVVYDITAQDQVVNVAHGTAKATIPGNKDITGTTVEEILLGNAGNKSVKSLLDILNKDQETQKKEKKIEVANQYSIVIKSDEIKNSLMVAGDYVNKEKTPFVPVTSSENVNERTAYKNKTGAIQKKIRSFSITAGMHILKVIDLVISQSTFIKDALNSFDKEQQQPVSESRDDTNVPNPNPKNLSWYNIVPFVKILNTGTGPNGKDIKREDYAHSITYVINKYEIPYIRSVYADKTSRYYGPHKRYNYWYTGQNSEVLSFDITFNHLYQNDIAKTSDARINNTNSQGVTTTAKSGINADTTGTMPGSNDVPATIKSWLYAPGDIQKFKLKILGDPDYLIPTYSATDMAKLNAFYGPDFTIDPSQGQVFIEIDFQQVEDYDSKTGLLKPNHDIFFANYPDYIKAKGFIYYINEVVSTFSKGKFEQDITGVVPEFAKIGNDSNRTKDENQSDAETSRLLRQGTKTTPTTTTTTTKDKNSGQSADALANASRKNAAANKAANPPKVNPVSKVADDDATKPKKPSPQPTTLEKMMQNTIAREKGTLPNVNNNGEPIVKTRSLREILGF